MMNIMIDNYDSFVYNLSAYFQELGQDIKVIRNDKVTINELKNIEDLSGIIISPGPGNPKDGGISEEVIKYVCNKAIIMYRGVIVEKLETIEHLEQTVCHPYSKELFAAVPVTSPFLRKERRISFPKGWDEPSTQGCVFQNRCTYCKDICKKIQPSGCHDRIWP